MFGKYKQLIFLSVVLLLVYTTMELFYWKLLNPHVYSRQKRFTEFGDKQETQFNYNGTSNIYPKDIINIPNVPIHATDTILGLIAKDTINNPSPRMDIKDTINDPSDTLNTTDTLYDPIDPINAKDPINSPNDAIHDVNNEMKALGVITIAQMVTEDQDYKHVNHTVVHIKSVILFTNKPVRYLLFSYDRAPQLVMDQIQSWPEEIRKRLSIESIRISIDDIPSMDYGITYDNMTRINASEPLTKIPYVLQIMLTMTQLKNVILMDSDSIVMSDITHTWELFLNFNESQFAGLGPSGIAFLPKNNKTKSNHYNVVGLNSGVFLLDVEKCRKSGLPQDMIAFLNQAKCPYSDACIMRRYFRNNPQTVYYLPCSYNLHTGVDPCRYTLMRPYCEAIYSDGIYIFHAAGSHDTYPPYATLHSMIKNYNFYQDGVPYWKEGLRNYTNARENCKDASVASLKYYMQKAKLLN